MLYQHGSRISTGQRNGQTFDRCKGGSEITVHIRRTKHFFLRRQVRIRLTPSHSLFVTAALDSGTRLKLQPGIRHLSFQIDSHHAGAVLIATFHNQIALIVMSFLLQEEHITQIRIKTFHQQIQLNRPETMIEVCRGTDTLGLLLFQVLGKLDNRHFATDSRHMQILVKRLRGTETARIRQTKINVLGRIETDIRTRTEDQMIDQIMFVETAADQKAPFLILPLVLQKQATDMNRLVHDTIIS